MDVDGNLSHVLVWQGKSSTIHAQRCYYKTERVFGNAGEKREISGNQNPVRAQNCKDQRYKKQTRFSDITKLL
jgi:hypothetical protein